jgi:hypothetical protein
MLVTFSSKSSADITMFGDIAVQLLNMMGHKGTATSAITAEDVAAALVALEAAIEEFKHLPEADTSADEEEKDSPVSLPHRALPLIKMLQLAVRDESFVMWASSN